MHRIYLLPIALLALGSCARPLTNFTAPNDLPVTKPVPFVNETEKAETYLWDFGDGNTSTDLSPLHRYLGSGVYTVKLTATDAKGKTATKEKKITVVAPDRCLAYIQTPLGNMIAEIYDSTPLHQDNFVKLVEQHYYDSLLFHRVIQGFMLQGGDPDSKNAPAGGQLGMGGPGYTIKAEFQDSLAHVKGALAAARTSNPQKRSSGSQFYIVQGRPVTDQDLNNAEGKGNFRYPSQLRKEYLEVGGTPFLDQEYTVFGKVIEGLDVLDRIAAVPTNTSNRPNTDVWMIIKLIR
ncbi:MAG: transcriptional regulator [Bacteroidetes bacterium]|nr:MAG: transcriptional regulator [Bacteroidota bacterium]PTM11028.1 MAG: transcriptional regulator [Bacteroidota bacterium]